MSVVAAHLYKNGKPIRALRLDGSDPAPAKGEFVWIGLHDPSWGELEALAGTYGLHPLAVEDAFQLHQFPKVDVYGDKIFLVVRSTRLRQGVVLYSETHIFAGPGYIITVRHGDGPAHGQRAKLESDPELLAHGVDRVLHGVLDFHASTYLPTIDRIEVELEELEKRAFDAISLTRFEVARVFELRRQLLRFSRILDAMSEVCGRLEHLQIGYLSPELRLYYRDTHDHVRRVEAMVEGLRETLSSVFEVSALLEQQKQSEISRKLAAWAAILAVPTAVAGLYGMNFDNMPELHWRFGYGLSLILVAAICVYLYARFRRANWL